MSASPDEFAASMARLRQDPLRVARVASESGQRVVGYVGNDIPVALILASGALPVRLRGLAGTDGSSVDRFVESSFSPDLRAIAGQWLSGSLDALDTVIFPRVDDSAQRLYYYLCELQRRGLCGGPRPLLYDVANLWRKSSFEHTLDSTKLLAAKLQVAPDRLEPAMQRVARRDVLARAVKTHCLLPSPLPGSAAWGFDYAAACDWREDFDDAARSWLDSAAMLSSPRRVVLAGDPTPDDQLHRAIENAGGSVVVEVTESSSAGDRAHADPLAAITDEFQRRESPALSMRRHARWLAQLAHTHRADAVVVWLSEQDEALPWEVARQMNSLHEAGIPALLLARQPWQITEQALMQVAHFVRYFGKHE